jgi:5-methylcytosine-specific restriction endonuclease McrA
VTEKRTPWMKFYGADWRANAQLRMCSLAARGLWIEMLCLAHDAEPYGHVLIAGRVPTMAQIAIQVGAVPREVEKLTAELEAAGVFDRSEAGAIVSRRMVRDREKAERNTENGHLGGHPDIRRGSVPKHERVRRFRRSDAPVKTRRIFDRDGGRCHWCRDELAFEDGMPGKPWHVDHVIPICDGGGNEEANLVAACTHCNGERALVGGMSENGAPVRVGNLSDHKAQMPEARSQMPDKPPSGAARKRQADLDLPSDWKPNEKHREKAEGLGVDCDFEAEKMRNWALAGGQRAKNWDARFHGWLQRAMELSNGGKPSNRTQASGQSLRDIQLAAALASCRD